MDNLVSPSRTITIGEKKYVLDGSFATLRAIQQHFDKDVVQILITITEMRLDQIADLIAIGSGQGNADEIGQSIADEIGANTIEYVRFKTQLVAWLNVAITPKASREKKIAEMDALVAKSTSLGQTTSSSASESSAGDPPNSGEATSGK